MANHVYTNVHITFTDPNHCSNFLDWIGHTPIIENTSYAARIETCRNIMIDNFYPEKEDSYAYYIDNIGAKWIFFDGIEYNDTEIYIDWTSAWSATDKLINRLGNFLIEQYPGVDLAVTYEDEGFGFVGAIFMNSHGSDSIEYAPSSDELSNSDSDEFIDGMIDKKQELLDACIDNVNNSNI